MINYKNWIFLLVASALAPCCALAASVKYTQPTFTEWHDQQVNEVNRFPVHTAFFPFLNEQDMRAGKPQQAANYLSLEGMWKFCWVADADQRPHRFFPY